MRLFNRILIIIIFGAVISGLLLFTYLSPKVALRIHFIHGQGGQAILVEAPESREAFLFDAGGEVNGLDFVRYLKNHKIKKLNFLILTHPHSDHYGGAFAVKKNIEVEKICDNGLDQGDLAGGIADDRIQKFYMEKIRRDSRYCRLKAGDSFSLGKANFKVLWPPQPPITANTNDNSIVILAEYNNFRCLLTSDATAFAEKELLKSQKGLKLDAWQVSHHGSIDATSLEFLQETKPGISVITSDKDFPSKRIIQRLKDSGSRVFMTYKDGDIVIEVKVDGSCRVKLANFWRWR